MRSCVTNFACTPDVGKTNPQQHSSPYLATFRRLITPSNAVGLLKRTLPECYYISDPVIKVLRGGGYDTHFLAFRCDTLPCYKNSSVTYSSRLSLRTSQIFLNKL
ncbi:hypothetical protein AB6A40_000854 [Gnathostoma spinigerum]|uniref:Uncharacterized protein n=1 Tax=Gnathostoma spinigerum TaxID=75299 RepID=A0ABD6ECV8_9BILA